MKLIKVKDLKYTVSFESDYVDLGLLEKMPIRSYTIVKFKLNGHQEGSLKILGLNDRSRDLDARQVSDRFQFNIINVIESKIRGL